MSEENPSIECAVCGRNGEPYAACPTCLGQAKTQPRQYTLSEIRSGKGPQEAPRYGDQGQVSPKTSPLVSGTQ